jgi:ABC-type transport system involved in cytochrome c biogenesis permease subunit
MSVEWWRTLHQPSSLKRGAIDPVMMVPLVINLAAFTILYLYLMSQRLHLGRLEEELLRQHRER